jgi:hypothetical protein
VEWLKVNTLSTSPSTKKKKKKTEKEFILAQFWNFKSMMSWLHLLWASDKVAHHWQKLAAEQGCSPHGQEIKVRQKRD